MNDKTQLGDTFKKVERSYGSTISKWPAYTIIRIDGRAFHSYLRHAQRPFDPDFICAMGTVAETLAKEMQGCSLAYHQSDEISFVMSPPSTKSEPWMGGRVQKMVSLSAALASVSLLQAYRPRTYKAQASGGSPLPTFDSRVFCLPNKKDVESYFQWRVQDATRNSISMLAQAHFSPKQLHGMKSGQMRGMLEEKGIWWEHLPYEWKHGQWCLKVGATKEFEYEDKRTNTTETTTAYRTWWTTIGTDPRDLHTIVKREVPDLPTEESSGPEAA